MPWTRLISQRYIDSGYRLEIRALILLALVTLGLMVYESPGRTWHRLQGLKGVLLFAAATLLLYVVMVLKAGVGLREYSTLATYPLVWIASSILGLAASRRPDLPLAVAVVGAWIGAVGGFLSYARQWGLRWTLVDWYATTAERVGGWRPGAGETFRAIGFDLDPNYYGLLGVVVLSFVLGLEGHRLLRITAAVGAALVIVMSGSRTAAFATLLVLLVWATVLVTDRKSARTRLRDSYGVISAIVGVMVVATIIAAAGGASQGAVLRASESVEAARGTTSTFDALVALTGGRAEIWRQGVRAYIQRPLGWFLPATTLLQGRSTHSEYLLALIEGGPLYLIVYLAFLAWLAFSLPAVGARSAGLLLATCLASSALMLTPLGLGAVVGKGFYFVGWLSGQRLIRLEANA